MTEENVYKEASQQSGVNKRQQTKDLHEKMARERSNRQQELRAHYAQVKDSPAVQDILSSARSFAEYHVKLAKDGIGARKIGHDESGRPIMEDYVLSQQERLSELDQAKGIEQLIVYIENKIN